VAAGSVLGLGPVSSVLIATGAGAAVTLVSQEAFDNAFGDKIVTLVGNVFRNVPGPIANLPDPHTFGMQSKLWSAIFSGDPSKVKDLLTSKTNVTRTILPLRTPESIQADIDLRRADIPKIRSTTTAVDGLKASLQKTSREIDLVGTKGGKSFGELVHSGGEYKALLDKLPKRVQTAIETPGMVETRRDIRDLARRYDLTPKQIRTTFQLLGLDKARRDFDALQAHMGRHGTFEQNIELASNRGAPLDGVRRR